MREDVCWYLTFKVSLVSIFILTPNENTRFIMKDATRSKDNTEVSSLLFHFLGDYSYGSDLFLSLTSFPARAGSCFFGEEILINSLYTT